MKAITYANGDVMKASYNSIGQMIAERWYDVSNTLTAHYKYVYDGQGNIVSSIDMKSEKEYNYIYEDGKVVRATEYDIVLNEDEFIIGKTVVNTVMYTYDSEGKLTRKRLLPAEGKEQTIYYENAEDDNTVVKFTAGGRTVTSHSKNDAFGRKVFDELQFETGFASRQFSYHVGQVTDTHAEGEKLKSAPTTQLVERIILSDGRILSYEYDAEERITKVTDSVEGVTEYTYDALGQLLAETHNQEVVNEMTYDSYGNILTKNGKHYTYGDVAWRDRLTAVDGKLITYDAQGNPTNYFGYELTWEKGRQLKSFEQNTYTYNANGIRTSKTVNGVTHTYTLDGTNILRETWGDNELVPMYDNEDNVCGIIYNDSPFYFLKNLQGDVIALVDKSGKAVARYSYDAWGVCTIQSDTSGCNIAMINPYRYRSYYYDTEIGMYYLQSRYYDPSVGRFVNGDEYESSTIKYNVLICNLYTYCCNNPVNETDADGRIVLAILKKILVGVVKGILSQFCIDIVEWALKNYVYGRRTSFKPSRVEDYVSAVLSQIFSEFKVSNIVGTAFRIVCLLIKYLPKIVSGKMGKKEWGNLLLDVISITITAILNSSLKKLNNKRAKLRKLRAKKPWNKATSIAVKYVCIKIKYKGIAVNVGLPVTTQLISTALNIFLR